MTRIAKVELRGLHIAASIGTYQPHDVVPEAHILDLTLIITPELVHIAADDMASVFDYDPLIAQIDVISRSQKFETQEYLVSLFIQACSNYHQIIALEISLRKQPVLAGTGSLGISLSLGADDLARMRQIQK
ncbi:MAG: dihydroneopterin aldolase [Acidocella sp.]|nr:dihydroneopterin aldolase [Acidocella sp.]